MATTAGQPVSIRFPERVNAPEELIASLGPDKIRKLHAAIVRAIANGQPLTIRVEPRMGRAAEVLVSAQVAL